MLVSGSVYEQNDDSLIFAKKRESNDHEHLESQVSIIFTVDCWQIAAMSTESSICLNSSFLSHHCAMLFLPRVYRFYRKVDLGIGRP